MQSHNWITTPETLLRDEALLSQVTDTFRHIYVTAFADEMMVNHDLPIEVRAIRNVEDWRVFLLLTPWMLSRVYLRFDETDIPIPVTWSVGSRANQPHMVLGPQVSLRILEQEQKTYLNYDPKLGHYLIQPLIMRMEPFGSASEVYESWNRVIETRDENIRKRHLECQWQREVSRREFFTRLRGSGERGGL